MKLCFGWEQPRGKTKASIELAISKGWIERKEQGVILLSAGRRMVRRRRP